MLSEARFHPERRSFGLEIELNLTDDAGDPALVNAAALEAIADPSFQTELGQFNVEINIAPRLLEGDVFSELERDARASLNDAEEPGPHRRRAHDDDRDPAHARRRAPARGVVQRQPALRAAQRADLRGARRGPGDRRSPASSGCSRTPTRSRPRRRAPACSCTSRSTRTAFARYWNAAQAIAGVQVAVAANSPFFYGKELWRETRIALFEQATDTRPEELKSQGVRPRVWFGERWITSIFDLFEENVQLLPGAAPGVRGRGSARDARARRRPAPRRAPPAQRDDLPLEPADLRRRRRPAPPPGGEPRAARRPDRRRHPGQRRVLLRPAAGAGRGGAAGVVADVVLGRRGELPRRRPRRDRCAPLLARAGARSPAAELVAPAPAAARPRGP